MSLFFFNDTATTEFSTLSLHDALPISIQHGQAIFSMSASFQLDEGGFDHQAAMPDLPGPDRKSTRLNSSHANISYAVFFLKKKYVDCNIILMIVRKSTDSTDTVLENIR